MHCPAMQTTLVLLAATTEAHKRELTDAAEKRYANILVENRKDLRVKKKKAPGPAARDYRKRRCALRWRGGFSCSLEQRDGGNLKFSHERQLVHVATYCFPPRNKNGVATRSIMIGHYKVIVASEINARKNWV